MRIVAFVGASGTGKSYHAIAVARKYKIDSIIDDGLLIAGSSVVAGVSAKREPTRLASVRRALFTDNTHKEDVISAIEKNNYQSVMILATSDAELLKKLKAYSQTLKESVQKKDARLAEVGYKNY